MGVESQNLLYDLAKLGIIEKKEHKNTLQYVLKREDVFVWRPDMEDLKKLESLCTPARMWVDTTEKEIWLEYNT